MKTPRNFLMHSNGTTPYETITVILPSLFYTVLTTIIMSLLCIKTNNVLLQFTLEFATLVIPLVLNVTIFSEFAFEIVATLSMLTVSVLFLLSNFSKTERKNKQEIPKIKDYITNSRSTINVLSVIAILAVDFLIFPRRFAKTETFGHSLMDVGVGLFIFSNAIVDGGQCNLFKSIKGSIPLIVLGTARLILTKSIDYNVPVSEYGVHWNFFLTLAATKNFVSLLFSAIDIKFIWINATLLMVSHEILLESGLKNLVFSTTKRDSFILANKEGLVSCLGYVCLYLFSCYFSYFMNLKKCTGNTSQIVMKFTLSWILTLSVSLLFQYFFGISRKLANTAYCFWVLSIGIFMTGLFYIFAKILEEVLEKKLNIKIVPSLIFQAINYNGLIFFLTSNLVTGLVNIVCDTLKVDAINSLIILFVYMLINCGIVTVLYLKKIKIKL